MSPLFLTRQHLITRHEADVRRLLAPVVEHAAGEFTLDDLIELARDGRCVLGLLLDDCGQAVLAIAFEVRTYPRKSVLNVMALGGKELATASTFWLSFKQWCQESGIDEIEARTRPAMTRRLRRLGFHFTYDVVRTGTAP